MKRTFLTLAAAIVTFSYACNSTNQADKNLSDSSTQQTTMTATDSLANPTSNMENNDFATHAAIGGMMEVESSSRMLKTLKTQT